jgi:hypothetical protein
MPRHVGESEFTKFGKLAVNGMSRKRRKSRGRRRQSEKDRERKDALNG